MFLESDFVESHGVGGSNYKMTKFVVSALSADGKEALALLLPLMHAYLRHASQAQQEPEQDPVVLSCKDRLLVYMVSKRKPAGASVSSILQQLNVSLYSESLRA